jgi:hypothetical protein
VSMKDSGKAIAVGTMVCFLVLVLLPFSSLKSHLAQSLRGLFTTDYSSPPGERGMATLGAGEMTEDQIVA